MVKKKRKLYPVHRLIPNLVTINHIRFGPSGVELTLGYGLGNQCSINVGDVFAVNGNPSIVGSTFDWGERYGENSDGLSSLPNSITTGVPMSVIDSMYPIKKRGDFGRFI